MGILSGAVWANSAWGSYWSWDPKETWAFIALMCYLFVLHGRFTGWWGNFGMSVGSVICFQAIVMAWYGVNFVLGELGGATGLHSYGTGAGGKQYVFGAVALDMLFTAIAVARHATYKNLTDKDDADPNTLTTTDPITEVRGEFLKPSESAGE